MLNKKQQLCANREWFSKPLPLTMGKLEARQENRRLQFRLLRKRYKTAAAFADSLGEGFSPSYVSQLLSGHRGIGDEVAEKIERRLSVPGYLDQPNSHPDPNTVSGLLAQLAPILDAAPTELRRAVLDLALNYQRNPADGARIVAAIRALTGTTDDPPA